MKPKGHKQHCQCVVCRNQRAKRPVRRNHGYENQATALARSRQSKPAKRVARKNSTVPLGTDRTGPVPTGNPGVQPSGTGNGWTVTVEAHEIPRLRYAAYIGHISATGNITLWRPAAGGIPRDYKQHAMRILETERDRLVPRPNPAHYPRTARGPKGHARWYILDLYDGKDRHISTRVRKGARAKLGTEAAGLVNRRVGKAMVRKVELSGPYARKPGASTPRK